jgi:EAL domain-containing protein (putative c-di-GMP-specific phosphodiesterase class I)
VSKAARDADAGPSGRSVAQPRANDRRHRERRSLDERLVAVSDILAAGGPRMQFQPVLSLTRLEVAGYEALARFPAPAVDERRRDGRPGDTEEWLEVGRAVGLGPQVEAAAVARALALGAGRPVGTVLAVNLSPSSLGLPVVEAVLPADLSGLEIELTENEAVADPPALRRRIDRLRERGALIAVDDVGAGHAGLRRVMDLAPDTVKLDRHLVDGVASNGATAALVRAVVHLADHIGAQVCAEGVESAEDLVALAELDVARAQGWFVGRPADIPAGVEEAAVEAGRRSLDRLFTGPPPASAPSTVADLVSRLTDVRDLADLEALAASSAPLLGCSRVVLGRRGPDRRLTRPGVAGSGGQPCAATEPDADLLAFADGDASLRARLADGVAVPVYAAGSPAGGSALLVPVRSRGEDVGLLACTRDGGAPWTRRQISAARLVATVLGPVLDSLTMQ